MISINKANLAKGGGQEGSSPSANCSNGSIATNPLVEVESVQCAHPVIKYKARTLYLLTAPLHCPTSLHLEPVEPGGDFSHWSSYPYFTPSEAFKCVHCTSRNQKQGKNSLSAHCPTSLDLETAEPA